MLRMRINSAARSEANPFAKGQKSKDTPEMIDSFSSSNIDALAYDPEKKQLWVRFKGQDVYTYYDVPLKIYRGFWSAPSKGHYFWEKIRKNPHIKFQKLTASLRWIKVEDILDLNCANRRANAVSVAKGVLGWMKKNHPEYEPSTLLRDVFNGKQIICKNFIVELVGYGNKIRCNIQDKYSGKIRFMASEEQDVPKLVTWVTNQIEKLAPTFKEPHEAIRAAKTNNTNVQALQAACTQLVDYLQEAIPEESFRGPYVTKDGFRLVANNYTVDVSYGVGFEDEEKVLFTVHDFWVGKDYDFEVFPENVVQSGLSTILEIALQGYA